MKLINKFKEIDFLYNGIILYFDSINKLEIKFSEIDKIFIKSNKVSLFNDFLSMLTLITVVFLSILYFIDDFFLIIGLLLITAIIVLKVDNYYKTYSIKVVLNCGLIYQKRIPLKYKSESIKIIDTFRKNRFEYSLDNCHQDYVDKPAIVFPVNLMI